MLVVYLTSHGASDFKLAASHWPLEVAPLQPGRAARGARQGRHPPPRDRRCRPAIPAAGSTPLASDTTLVMTAADATHTSYGCGRLSELTFFGRALFDEQLRKTHSFEQAFAAAVPVIKQREIDAGKQDGFSNPQISVGADIAPGAAGAGAAAGASAASPQPGASAAPSPGSKRSDRALRAYRARHEPVWTLRYGPRMNPLFLKLGWRTLLRDLRAGELRLLIVAVTLAVAALTAVGFFADRLKGGLQRDARQLLGGDAVVRSDAPTPAGLHRQGARRWACKASPPSTFPTMGRAPRRAGRRQQAGRAQGRARRAIRCAAA